MRKNSAGRMIATIPTRGGSKRIPYKSLQRIGDKSLLQRCIEKAFNSEVFESVFVNTDDEQIAQVAVSCGAQVPYLRKHFGDDYSPVSSTTVEFSKELADSGHIDGNEFIVQLMPNCPFLESATIIEFLTDDSLNEDNSLLSAIKLDPLARFAFELEDDGEPKFIFTNTSLDSRTQDFPQLFIPSGAIWVAHFDYLIREGTYYGKNYRFKIISELEGMDIDTPKQLETARLLSVTLSDY